jgi:hypothetical protein
MEKTATAAALGNERLPDTLSRESMLPLVPKIHWAQSKSARDSQENQANSGSGQGFDSFGMFRACGKIEGVAHDLDVQQPNDMREFASIITICLQLG